MTGASRISETPMAGRIAESPEAEDDLGELMVMTDEDDTEDDDNEDDDSQDQTEPRVVGLIPETPAK